MRMFLVGGSVRDFVMGRQSSDVDFAVEASTFDEMVLKLRDMGLKVWQARPEFVTLRGAMPYRMLAGKYTFDREWSGDPNGIVNADFTLCRAETMYTDKRHPDTVTPTTIECDLLRRDYTANAIAMREDGTLLDPQGGESDIKLGVLRTVGQPEDRLREDPLRILRAVRFTVTHGLIPDEQLAAALNDSEIVDSLSTLPVERVREELNQALSHSWRQTLLLLMLDYPKLAEALDRWHDSLWLRATTEDR